MSRRAAVLMYVVLPVLGTTPGCAATGSAGSGAGLQVPPAAASAEARRAEEATRIATASRLIFTWRAREPDFRGSGTGVARVEPPDRARLDLFLNNGEVVASAALVGDDLRVGAELPSELVPPPTLFWAALGVFRPGAGATLVEARRHDGVTELGYRVAPGGLIRFRLRFRDHAVTHAMVLEGGAVVEQIVASDPEPGTGYPAEATYRNLQEHRELRLQLESLEHVDSFPPEIWLPGLPGLVR